MPLSDAADKTPSIEGRNLPAPATPSEKSKTTSLDRRPHPALPGTEVAPTASPALCPVHHSGTTVRPPATEARQLKHPAQYLEEPTRMMQAWADYLDGLKSGAKVVPFKRQA